MRKTLKGGSLKGPIMKPDLTSFPMRSFTASGSAWADWRLLQMWFWESAHSTPGLKPWLRPYRRYSQNSLSGWWVSSVGNFNIFYSQLWTLGIRRERGLHRRNCRCRGSNIVVWWISGYWTKSMTACCPPRMELVVRGLNMRRLLVLGRSWWTSRRWVLGMEWQRDWSVGNSWWSGQLTGTRHMQCSCNLGTPCCGDLGRERPSRGIGSTAQLGRRTLRRTVCGTWRSALLRRTTRVRLWWPGSRWARVACEGRLSI